MRLLDFPQDLTSVIGAWGRIGVAPLATSLTRICPRYPLLGFSSCPVKTG